jgi:hypothetical protein
VFTDVQTSRNNPYTDSTTNTEKLHEDLQSVIDYIADFATGLYDVPFWKRELREILWSSTFDG